MSNTTKPSYDTIGKIYILIGRFKGHTTFRLVFSGKSLLTLKAIRKTHKDQVEEWKLSILDTKTGKIGNSLAKI